MPSFPHPLIGEQFQVLEWGKDDLSYLIVLAQLLSSVTDCSGEDSTIRCFSTVHDSYNKSLGRASYNKAKTKKSGLQLDEHRMPPVIDFASGL